MEPTLDLTNKKQRQEAEHGAAEKICSEIIPCLFHDAERKAWIRLLLGYRYETFAIDSDEMTHFLKRTFWEEMKRSHGRPEAMPAKLLKERLEYLKSMALYDGEHLSDALCRRRR
jgi:hypothetical protein